MKKHFLKTGIALFCLLTQSMVNAQPVLVAPTGSDVLWVTGPSIGCGINTAMIDFPCGDITPNYPYGRLAACAYGGGPGGVVVTDLNSLHTVNITYPVFSSRTMASCPDVILGNKASSPNPTQDFVMAVAFVNDLGQIEVNYFDINYATQCDTTFTVTYHSRQIIPTGIGGGWTPLGTVHIDVVAQSTNTSLYGMPLCDKFFVTYDATTTAPVYNVFATFGNLNGYTATVAGPVNISTGAMLTTDGWQPDVAGVERGPMIGPKKPIACITYVEQSTHRLYYQEWDPLGAVVGPFTAIGGTTISGGVYCAYSLPRIDADDDYTTNAGACSYQVASEYFDPTVPNNDVRIYNPGGVTASSSWVDVSPAPVSGPTPYYNQRVPGVAFGPIGPAGPGGGTASQYMVTQCANTGSGDYFVMSPMNICGTALAWDPSAAQDYFLFNSGYPSASTNFDNAVSTPCNFVSDISLVAWTDAGNIYYKTNIYGGATGYAYKHSSGISSGTSRLTPEKETLRVFPNPTTDLLNVDNPVAVGADRYNIKNVIGQIVMDGCMVSGKMEVNVSKLPSGTYIMRAFKEGIPAGNTVFVKK